METIPEMKHRHALSWLRTMLEITDPKSPCNTDPMYRDLRASYDMWTDKRGIPGWQRLGSSALAIWLQQSEGIQTYQRRNDNGPKHPVSHYAGIRVKRDADQAI